MRERGSALLVAIVSVMVLLLISGVFFSLVTDQMKSNSYEERAIKSYYLAQAGIFYGVAKIRANVVPVPDSTGKSTQPPILNPFGYGGQYYVEWQKSEDGQYYTITSKGSYGSGTGEVDRILQAYYKFGTGGTGGEVPMDIITQAILNYDHGHEILGQGNTSFVFSNSLTFDRTLPVNFSQPIYIFTINHGDNTIAGNSEASHVRISLRNSNNETLELTNTTGLERDMSASSTVYMYKVPDFQTVSTPFTMSYEGNEIAHLVVEGYITRSGQSPSDNDGTGTITNEFLASPDSGLIWQVEN